MCRAMLCFVVAVLFVKSVGAEVILFGGGVNEFSIEFVPIGNPGNVADMTGDPSPAGSVPYSFQMGKFEVSRDMVIKANAAAAVDGTGGDLEISLQNMGFVAGGRRSAMPATGVSWNEAARFVNWLNTSLGHEPAYKFNTQPGEATYYANERIELWEAGDAGFSASNQVRNSLARFVLPSVDEWYKSAYYYAPGEQYFDFPTAGTPKAVERGTDPFTAAYDLDRETGPADITQAGGLSPYGTMGQAGNASEWMESSEQGVRGAKRIGGGRWYRPGLELESSRLSWAVTNSEEDFLGFRVADTTVAVDANTVTVASLGDCNKDGLLDASDLDCVFTTAVVAPGDCSLDGIVNALDLACVADIDQRNAVLQALGTLPGDLDGDGAVAFADLLSLAQHFGEEPASYPHGNIDLEGAVAFNDFLSLTRNFGRSAASAASVPEPSGNLAIVLSVAMFLAGRRRRAGVEGQLVGVA